MNEKGSETSTLFRGNTTGHASAATDSLTK